MKTDIQNRNDIEWLVNCFYRKVLADDELGFIFEKVAKANWSTHLPIMYNFWENIILFTGSYDGNPMQLHEHLHNIKHINETHFDKWNALFLATVNENFEGSNAELAKLRAINISRIIKKKILQQLDC
jgi:hemoglobin